MTETPNVTSGPTFLGYTPAQLRKAIVAFVGLVCIVLATAVAVGGVLPVAALPYVTIFLAVCTQVGIFKVPNED